MGAKGVVLDRAEGFEQEAWQWEMDGLGREVGGDGDAAAAEDELVVGVVGVHAVQVVVGEVGLTPRAKRVIELAIDEARRLGHNYIGTEHLLLGILREERSVAASILMEKGMRLNTVREDIVALLEACYRIEQTEQGWLEGCAEAARPFIDRGLGHIAVTYELARSGEETFPARVIAGPAEFERKAPHILKMIPLELVRAWKRRTLGCASGERSQHAFRDEDRRPGFAMPDGFLALGTEFADRGCVLAGRLAHPRLTATQRRCAAMPSRRTPWRIP